MQKVTIVGAGIAGMTAALRLAQRGYKVTLFERDDFVGGKFRATEWVGEETKRRVYHEHSYHMFLNWYHNFWEIAKDIGVKDQFAPLNKVKFLKRGEFPYMKELVDFGAPSTILTNLFSGVLPLPHMFLYMYSVLDLLSTPMLGNRFRDLISVNGFASTKPYATEASVKMYDEYLAKTFAIASYQSSAKTFRTFLQYGTYCPEPLYLALKGDCYNHFLRPFLEKLTGKLGVDVKLNHEVTALGFGPDGLVSDLTYRVLPKYFSPSLSELTVEEALGQKRIDERPKEYTYPIEGSLIVAIPHVPLQKLISPTLLNKDTQLGESAKLQSVPMASIHLHLNEKFTARMKAMGVELPKEPVVLVNSKYKLSFVDNSRLWPDYGGTYLNVVASDSRPLNRLNAPEIFTSDKQPGKKAPELKLEAPQTTLDYALNELQSFLFFENDEIDIELLQIDRNVGRELFINEVGSWQWRPTTVTKVENLFLAGDFCKNSIDVVCLEGAVVSGLEAAEHVRRRGGLGVPIHTIFPEKYPTPLFWPLKLALAPYAVGAKLWTIYDTVMKRLN